MDSQLREQFRKAVREETGLALDDDHGYLLDRTVRRFVASGRASDPTEFVESYLQNRDADLTGPLIKELVSDETYFFRDRHPFEGLRDEILPALLEDVDSRPVRIWSAACSTGQEPYSIAFLVHEAFPEAWPERFEIFASDLSAELLEQARSGRYSQLEINRGLPAEYLPRFFDQDVDGWWVVPEIRERVEFEQVDLTAALSVPHSFDVVVLRYLLTYYTDRARRCILERIHAAMNETSYLILGGAETWANIHDGFELLRTGASRYYRRVSR